MSSARLVETVRLFVSGEKITGNELTEWVGLSHNTHAYRYLRLLSEAKLIEPCGFQDLPEGCGGHRSVVWRWRQP